MSIPQDIAEDMRAEFLDLLNERVLNCAEVTINLDQNSYTTGKNNDEMYDLSSGLVNVVWKYSDRLAPNDSENLKRAWFDGFKAATDTFVNRWTK